MYKIARTAQIQQVLGQVRNAENQCRVCSDVPTRTNSGQFHGQLGAAHE